MNLEYYVHVVIDVGVDAGVSVLLASYLGLQTADEENKLQYCDAMEGEKICDWQQKVRASRKDRRRMGRYISE